MARTCYDCGKPAVAPEQVSTFTGVPYRRNGWVGTTFVPYDKKYKSIKESKRTVCGLCFAQHEIKNMEAQGEDVTELQQYLAEIAEREVTARVQSDSHTSTNGVTNHATKSVAPTRRRRKAKRQQMTAEQATDFDRYSDANIQLVEGSLSCECQAYADTFTYKRWRAQGYQVQRGEHGIKIPVFANDQQVDEDSGEVTDAKRIKTTATVFCRHQVKSVESKAVAA